MTMSPFSLVLSRRLLTLVSSAMTALVCGYAANLSADEPPIAQYPLYGGGGVNAPPLTMLVMGRDHTLYYEAYNDASDLNGDGVLDVGYKPNMIGSDGNRVDYFGYFDSDLCYDYDTGNGRFEPTGQASTKKCSGNWSGDFLNYLTTSRVDALRKVLYGGKRIIDQGPDTDSCTGTDCLTVLERSYIPQDAHSWGKEYKSIDHDGYDIADYTPLSAPPDGMRHLFANTTLLKTGNKEPLLRVLPNSAYRIWEWVAIERPVAGDKCLDGGKGPSCETSGGSDWQILPSSYMSNLTQTTFKHDDGHPDSLLEFDTMVATYATEDNLCGTKTVSTIDGTGNPFAGENGCTNDKYLTIFQGELDIPEDGTYTFGINGDDAVDLLIDTNGDGIMEPVVGWYDGHGAGKCSDHSGNITLDAGTYDFVFRHEEGTGSDSYYLCRNQETSSSEMTDYIVRVEVCDHTYPDAVCQDYPAGTKKPVGVLQSYGESDEMLFGLLTGSYGENMAGGVLRKNIESLQDEINPLTGQFTDAEGIVRTIDKFRIVDFSMNQNYQYTGGWRTTSSMATGGYFPDWGNPIGEMVYETLRYFSGKESATSDFMPGLTSGKERVTLKDYDGDSYFDLPAPDWRDPYRRYTEEDGTYTLIEEDFNNKFCSPAAQLIISDVNPSYDTDQVPGSPFGSFSGDILGLDAAAEANIISSAEGLSGSYFIGQSGTEYDGAPSAKTITGLGNIRGLSPSEPTKQGGFYTAGIARYGYENDLREDIDVDVEQIINTFSVALASPLPRIDIPVGDGQVTVVPFAKSVGGSSINAAQGQFQPTNTIVDFFIEKFANTAEDDSDADPDENEGRPYIKFRINYEDVEQGADHDMDAIVAYELKVDDSNQLIVSLDSEYAAGGIIQHMGYVISGTTADGVYLEVRDEDTGEGSDPDYFLDTHAGQAPGACTSAPSSGDCNDPLPLNATRTFTVSDSADVATVLESPLWYAAKYGSGGTREKEKPSENYFLVTNAGTLQEQLDEAFKRIVDLGKKSVATVAATPNQTTEADRYFKASFDPEGWFGDIEARQLDDDDNPNNDPVDWAASNQLPAADDRNIYTSYRDASGGTQGVTFTVADLTSLPSEQKATLGTTAEEQQDVLNYLRGDQTKEQEDPDELPLPGEYRQREILIGDIVNSSPIFVGAVEDFGYAERTASTSRYKTALPPETPGAASYSGDAAGFVESSKTRQPMIYVGANDGMLHAFNADTGVEVFAYVPRTLFPKLKKLSEPDYNDTLKHLYYVDGTPQVNQAYFEGDDEVVAGWRSVLLGSLGAGGRGLFALDVTDPLLFDETKVLWEINTNDSDFIELGYLVNQMPMEQWAVGRLYSGEWVAIFGNGYDSLANETYKTLACDDPSDEDGPKCERMGAYLFIVNIETGELIKKIRAPAPQGASGDARNGLSAVGLIQDRNAHVVAAYAGDLLGNLWKFDLSSASSDDWEVAYGGEGDEPPLPLFTATDADGNPQPIVAPALGGDLGEGAGYIVNFGTGQFMREGDEREPVSPDTYQVQSVYGVWDAYSLSYDEDDPDATGEYPSNVGEPPTWKIDEAGIEELVLSQDGGTTANMKIDELSEPIPSRDSLSLGQQTIEAEVKPDGSDDIWLVISQEPFVLGPEATPPDDDPLPTPQKRGWLIDLIVEDGEAQGDRIISTQQNLAGSGYMTFTALRPDPASAGQCTTGETSTILCTVDIRSGAGPGRPLFDLNEDGKFDEDDLVPVNGELVPPSCKETELSGAPRILLPELPEFDEERDDVDRVESNWSKTATVADYTADQLDASPPAYTLIMSDGSRIKIRAPIPGRQGWRQIR
ncbi:PilC/PilY family type IV pilus protein [Thiorhodovibrio frisius]|uniref:Tfp pilus assembly protein, tip-associated adhesin PilY1 n=1 Tax=Thiorhodovibrio frisius TaxID=631362 RepID=H8YXH7_9GAMM|nr:PilC/PilY family type IV pilus protein [Thiorhodovibrio frisius]EIC23153.1 Tfp pilus assembly protein, tip-associated adhesin PilY1 [Thiorhodovibrio frisius]WPL22576.1 Tfp pilus assembly protein, tip-associated adhesin PilY1 [Thiorhodovibrio frisius]